MNRVVTYYTNSNNIVGHYNISNGVLTAVPGNLVPFITKQGHLPDEDGFTYQVGNTPQYLNGRPSFGNGATAIAVAVNPTTPQGTLSRALPAEYTTFRVPITHMGNIFSIEWIRYGTVLALCAPAGFFAPTSSYTQQFTDIMAYQIPELMGLTINSSRILQVPGALDFIAEIAEWVGAPNPGAPTGTPYHHNPLDQAHPPELWGISCSKKKCSCDIHSLMREGCKCGGV